MQHQHFEEPEISYADAHALAAAAPGAAVTTTSCNATKPSVTCSGYCSCCRCCTIDQNLSIPTVVTLVQHCASSSTSRGNAVTLVMRCSVRTWLKDSPKCVRPLSLAVGAKQAKEPSSQSSRFKCRSLVRLHARTEAP